MDFDVPVADVEEAIRLGADAISVGLIVGGQNKKNKSLIWRRLANQPSNGMPLIAHAYPRGSLIEDQKDPDAVAYAVRTAVELGVDIVKTNWNGSPEKFAKAVRSITKLSRHSGGAPKMILPLTFKMTEEQCKQGFWCNVWQICICRQNPAAVIAAVKSITSWKNC